MRQPHLGNGTLRACQRRYNGVCRFEAKAGSHIGHCCIKTYEISSRGSIAGTDLEGTKPTTFGISMLGSVIRVDGEKGRQSSQKCRYSQNGSKCGRRDERSSQ